MIRFEAMGSDARRYKTMEDVKKDGHKWVVPAFGYFFAGSTKNDCISLATMYGESLKAGSEDSATQEP